MPNRQCNCADYDSSCPLCDGRTLSTAVSAALPPTEHPEPPQLTIQHALIMLTYAVEQNFGELTIPYSYVLDKVNGTSPANLDVFQNEDGSVTMKVKSENTRTRIIL